MSRCNASIFNTIYNHRSEKSSLDPFAWIEINGGKVGVIEGLNRPEELEMSDVLEAAKELTSSSILRGDSFHIGQVYQYLILRNICYAILTTHNKWVFLKLGQDEDGGVVLKVSDTLLHNASKPSLHQAIFYFLDLLQQKGDSKINFELARSFADKNRERENNVEGPCKRRRVRCNGMRVAPRGALKRERKDGGLGWAPSDSGWNFEVCELRKLTQTTIAEEGAGGGFFKGEIDGRLVVTKMRDRFNNMWGVEMMDNEVEMRKRLHEMQGKVIPEFYHCEEHGIVKLIIMSCIEGKEHEAWLGPRGVIMEKAVTQLTRMHSLGVAHGDVKRRNMLAQCSPPQVWLIDFGFFIIKNE